MYAYDGSDRVTSVTEVLDRDGAGAMVSDRRVFSLYDTAGRVTHTVVDLDGDGVVPTRVGSSTVIDDHDAVREVRYSPAGRVLQVIEPPTDVTTFDWDDESPDVSPVDGIDDDKRVTTYAYDDAGRVRSVSHPDGRSEEWSYTPDGRVDTHRGLRGEVTDVDYNALGLPTEVTGPSPSGSGSVVAEIGWDARGLRTSWSEPHEVGFVGEHPSTVHVSYDSWGQVDEVVDANGTVVDHRWDAGGRLRARELVVPAGEGSKVVRQRWDYDLAGRLVFESLPHWVSEEHVVGTGYGYDNLGRVSEVRYGEVDLGSLEIGSPERVGVFDHWPSGRIRTETWSAAGGTQRLEYFFDAAGRRRRASDVGDPLVSGDGFGASEWVWDRAGGLVGITSPDGEGGSSTVSRTFDLGGRPRTLTYPGGTVFQYWHDRAGRLKSSQVWSQTAWLTLASYSYDDWSAADPDMWMRESLFFAGYRQWTSNQAGVVTDYVQSVNFDTSSVYDVDLDYDHAGRLVSEWVDDDAMVDIGSSYGYDDAGQLTEVLRGGDSSEDGVLDSGEVTKSWLYEYDGRGLRTGECVGSLAGGCVGGTRSVYAYNDAGELVSQSVSGETDITYSVEHDGEGRWSQLMFPGDYGAEVLEDDPVGYWRFSEPTGLTTLADSSGNGHGASFSAHVGSDPVLGQRGAIARDDGAVRFDGGADAVGVDWDEDFVFDGSFAFEFWAKTHEESPLAGGDVGIIDNSGHPSDGDGAFRVQVDDVDQHLVFRRDSGQSLAAGASLSEDWQHFVVSYDADVDTLTWYANGEVDSTHSGVTFAADTNGGDLRFGRDPFASVSLDEVAVYGEALDASRVAAHFGVGHGTGRLRVGYSPAGRLASMAVEADDGAGGWRKTFEDVRSYDGAGQLAELGWVDYDESGGVEASDETSLLWDPGRGVPQVLEFVHDGVVTRENYGIHRISQNQITNRWFSYDAHDNVTASTGVAAPSSYDPFGAPVDPPAGEYWFGFRGELHTGSLVHLRARDYAPSVGLFTTRDPLGGVLGTTTVTNAYHYADNDPINKVDPLGLRPSGSGFCGPLCGSGDPPVVAVAPAVDPMDLMGSLTDLVIGSLTDPFRGFDPLSGCAITDVTFSQSGGLVGGTYVNLANGRVCDALAGSSSACGGDVFGGVYYWEWDPFNTVNWGDDGGRGCSVTLFDGSKAGGWVTETSGYVWVSIGGHLILSLLPGFDCYQTYVDPNAVNAGLCAADLTPLGKLRELGRLDEIWSAIRHSDDAAWLARHCRSFSGDTPVLMANGTTKAIADVQVGDEVLATDPETGETGAREVIATLPHTDQLLTLKTSSGEVVTTEDHKYWNATDQAWQESQDLDEGDQLLSADGDIVTVEGLDWATVHTDAAYDLTIADLHTFYVGAGVDEVLVHNCGELTGSIGRLADDLGYTSREIRDAIHAAKRNLPPGAQRNPDVLVDLKTGEIYPKLPSGSAAEDSIGNIVDYLPER